jgi:hypothetical protein
MTRKHSEKRELKGRTYLLWGDGSLIRLPELFNHTGVTSKIFLAANKDDWQPSAEMHNFGNPL